MCATRAFLWAALFLWMTPLVAALSMRDVSCWATASAVSRSCSATLVSSFLNRVRMTDFC